MKNFRSIFAWRRLPSKACDVALATAVSVLALSAVCSDVLAQAPPSAPSEPAQSGPAPTPPAPLKQGQGTLPPTAVEPPKQAAPKQVPVPVPQIQVTAPPIAKAPPKQKQIAVPKAAPKQVAPEPAPVAATEPTPAEVNPATALGPYNPALDLRNLTLPPGTTLTTAGPVQGYRALSAMSSTKTATPIEQIPQSIQVIPRSVLDDQRPVAVDEALRNVSSVQATNALQTPAYESTLIRGFAAEQWLDGMSVYYNGGNRDGLVNVERIEVLKGPSAILYGGGAGSPVGGAVNVISKLPTDKAFGEVGIAFGSHRYFLPYFDINQPLTTNGTALFRVTGEYNYAESFIDVLKTDRYSINPTLTLTNREDTTLTIQARFSRWSQPEYQGLPATGTVAGNFRIDPSLFIGPSNMPNSYSNVQGVTVTLDHKFNEYVDASVRVRASRQEFAERAQTIVGADSFQGNSPFIGPSTWALSNIYLQQQQNEFTINPNVRFKFATEWIKNTILVGADYSHLTDKGILTSDFFLGGVGLVDLANPSFPTPYVQPPDSLFTTFQKPGNTYVTQGAYAQWQGSIQNRLHLLAGVRATNIQIDYIDPAGGADFHTDTTRILPRIGGVLDIVPGLSVYASYSEGLKANPYTFFVGRPEPEESKQKEAGLKFNLGNTLTGTLAVFEIDRSKVPVAVGGGFTSAAIGEQRSQGFEADAIWQFNRNWKMFAQYAHVETELLQATPTAAAGNSLAGVPVDSGRLWFNYAFDPGILKGWSIGAGIYAASGSFVDLPNLYKTQSYYTVDARLGYEDERYKAALNVKNITDEKYFVPYSYFGGRVAPGPDQAFYGSFAVKY